MRHVLDVVLFHGSGTPSATTARPLAEDVQLGNGVRIAPIHRSVAVYIEDLCDPHRLRSKPVQQMPRALYAFMRAGDFDVSGYTFDPDGVLNEAIAISRLLRPTSIGFEYSARLIFDHEGTDIAEALPGHIKGAAAYAYVAGEAPQNFITGAEAEQVARLFAAYTAGKASRCERVKRALWRHEYAARDQHLDIRWLLVASGLEALLKVHFARGTRGPGSTKQFKDRSVGLAARYRISWTAADAERAYELRSEMAHGQQVTHGSPDLPLYITMEMLLRYALIEALTEPAFEALFRSDALIETTFPLQP